MNASAGSGKTYRLAYKYIRDVIAEPRLYRRILAVTFTNKATEEMKSRILDELYRLSTGTRNSYMQSLCEELATDPATVAKRAAAVLSDVLHDYSHFTVLTIDKFFQRILRAFIRELGIDLDYNIEIETASVLSQSADALVESITADEQMRQWMSEYARELIESGRRWDIREEIKSLGGEIFKESNREALQAAMPKQELAAMIARLTKRLGEVVGQYCAIAQQALAIMHASGVSPDDFKGKSKSFAHYFTRAAAELTPPTATVLKCAASTDGWCSADSPAAPLVAQLQPLLAGLCDSYRSASRLSESVKALQKNFRGFALLTDLYAKVRELCEKQNTMLLSETKHVIAQFIHDNDAPFIYEKVGNRFDRLMIDEFQDTSAKEWDNFLPLLRNAMAQSADTSVFIVGDVKQSIYRWRGGDWRILAERAGSDLGHNDVETIRLRDNYRSLPRIVEFNNAVIGSVVARDNELLSTRLDQAVADGTLTAEAADSMRGIMSQAYDAHDQNPRKRCEREGYVRVETYGAEPPLVECIKGVLDDGFRPSDIMILVSRNRDGAAVADTLLEFKSSNTDPRYRFDVMTQEALIIGRLPVVLFVIAVMKLSADNGDGISRTVVNRFTGRPLDEPLDEQLLAFLASIRMLSPEEAFEQIVMHTDIGSRADCTAGLQALHEQIIGYCSNRIADIPLFVAWWEEHGREKSLSVERSEQAIEIMTVHKAKGLEKPVVIIPYCNWRMEPLAGHLIWATAGDPEIAEVGAFPVNCSKTGTGTSHFSEGYYRESVYAHVDSMNLLYVALTRASEALYAFIPADVRNDRIGRHLLEALPGIDGVRTTELDEGLVRFEYGTQAAPLPDSHGAAAAESIKLERYPVSSVGMRLHLPSQRYFEEGQSRELSPRNFGILMHRAFENASDQEDIFNAVEQMHTDGTLDDQAADTLRGMLRKALAEPLVHEWFSGSWNEVRNESDIVIPGSRSVKRPDRVMIRDGRAVVVDYKFGGHDNPAYRRQIAGYMRLLQSMGYRSVEGYIWYVRSGRIEQVELQ